jgi:hypothetical protein
MSKETVQQRIAELLRETGRAHHQAFIETDGHDPAWCSWYADYLDKRLSTLLKVRIIPGELADLLVKIDQEHRNQATDVNWAEYYAGKLIDTYLKR